MHGTSTPYSAPLFTGLPVTSASPSLKSLGRNVEVGNRKRDEEVHAS